LIHLLQTSDSYTRYLAAWALGHVHEEEATTVDALIVALDDNHEQVSTAAQMSLGEFKSQEKVIVPAMIKKLSDTNAAVRAQATRTLGELSPCQDKGLAKMVVAALIKSLADTNNNVRGGAAWALGDNGEAAKDAIPELLELTNSDDKYLRNEARAALMAIDFEAAKKAGLVN
jgi:HEAT repeat protein